MQKTLEKQKLNIPRGALFRMKTIVSLRYFVNDCRFDGQLFVRDLERNVEIREHQCKEPRQIRYIHYGKWAVALRRKNIGSKEVDNPVYTFLKVILNFLRVKVPGNVAREFKEGAYEVKMEEFCKALDLRRL